MSDKRHVEVGTVIFLEPDLLGGDAEVLCPDSPSSKARPYVCLAMQGQLSVWLALTSKEGEHHFPIPREQRAPMNSVWASGPCFVNRRFATHVGPTTRILAAVSPDDLLDGLLHRNIHAAWITKELVHRCRLEGANWFNHWRPGCGAKTTAAPETRSGSIGRPVITAEVKARLQPAKVTPAPTVKPAKVTPDETNWADFISIEPGAKGGGKR